MKLTIKNGLAILLLLTSCTLFAADTDADMRGAGAPADDSQLVRRRDVFAGATEIPASMVTCDYYELESEEVATINRILRAQAADLTQDAAEGRCGTCARRAGTAAAIVTSGAIGASMGFVILQGLFFEEFDQLSATQQNNVLISVAACGALDTAFGAICFSVAKGGWRLVKATGRGAAYLVAAARERCGRRHAPVANPDDLDLGAMNLDDGDVDAHHE